MTSEPTNVAPAQLPGERDTVLDWGAGRRQDAQLVMRSVLKRVEGEAFTGSRMRAGQVAIEFDDPVATGAFLQAELAQYLQDMGADVVLSPGDMPALGIGELPQAPWETLIISGTVPGNALLDGKEATSHIIEACAEVVRVLLAQAVLAASEEAAANERIVVLFRKAPELGGTINLQTGIMAGMVRVACIIHAEFEPRVSYLLGTAYGEPKPRTLAWEFPLVEQIYGPHRLHWRDLRSPDYEPGPDAPTKLVAS